MIELLAFVVSPLLSIMFLFGWRSQTKRADRYYRKYMRLLNELEDVVVNHKEIALPIKRALLNVLEADDGTD